MRTARQLREAAQATGYFASFQGDGASIPYTEFFLLSPPTGLALYVWKLWLDSVAGEAFRLHDFLYTPYGSLIGATQAEADSALASELSHIARLDRAVVYSALRDFGFIYFGRATAGFRGFYLGARAYSENPTLSTLRRIPMASSLDVAVVAIRQQLNAQDVYNVLTFTQSNLDPNPFGIAELILLRDAVAASQITNISPLQSVQLTYVDVVAYSLGASVGLPAGGPPFTRYVNPKVLQTPVVPLGPVAGGTAGDSLPRISAVKSSKETGWPQRTRRGAIHFAGVPEPDTTIDRLNNGPWLAWVAGVNAHIVPNVNVVSGGAPFTFNPCVYSPTTIDRVGVPGVTGAGACYRITATIVNTKVGGMKRRKIKGGPR